jgi:multidrug resistance efflux pump
MKKLLVLFSLLLVVTVAISGCSPKTEEPIVTEGSISQNYLIAEGRLMPANYLDQSFSVPGQVLEVLVKEGDAVELGQVIAKLDVPYDAMVAFSQNQLEVQNAQIALDNLKKNADLNLAQAKLDVFNAQTVLEEAKEDFDAEDSEENQLKLTVADETLKIAEDNMTNLVKGNGINPNQLNAAESRVTTAMTAMLAAQAIIDNHQLKSNATGNVASINLKVGERVAVGVPVITYADFANWEIKTDNLTEIDVVEIKIGQKVEVVLDAISEKTFEGVVTDIGLVYEEKRGDTTYTVTIVLDQSDPLMRWGMTAAVQFLP